MHTYSLPTNNSYGVQNNSYASLDPVGQSSSYAGPNTLAGSNYALPNSLTQSANFGHQTMMGANLAQSVPPATQNMFRNSVEVSLQPGMQPSTEYSQQR